MGRSKRDRARRRARGPTASRTWLGRAVLLLLGLEIALHIPQVPPWWEAGIWSGNIWSDRVWVWGLSLLKPGLDPRGYRHTDWRPAEDRPLAVALGDSRVYGHYVQPDEAFPQQMDRSDAWRVANLGLPGASVVEALDFIVDDALGLRPTGALVCYDVNSSLHGVMSREEAGSRSAWGVQLVRSSALLRWTELGLRAALVERHPVMPVERYEALMVDLLGRLEAAGVTRRVVLVGWTELEDYPTLFTGARYERFRQASRDAARANGAEVLEMEAVFEGIDSDEVFVGEERMHLSPWAHQRMAEAALEALGPPP